MMSGRIRAGLALIAVGLCCMAAQFIFDGTLHAVTAQANSLPEPKPFQVFDGTLYAEKPDLLSYGIQPITMIYAGTFGPDWHKQSENLPEKETVQRVAREAQAKAVM